MPRRGRSIERIRLVPDIPGIRFRSPFDRELEQQAEFQEWRLRHGGSFPEYLVFKELEKRGLEFEVDFQFQTNLFGGRARLGGAVVDFIVHNVLAGRVQGEYFHFARVEQRVANIIQRRQLEQKGFVVIDMLAEEIQASPSRIVNLFLQAKQTARAEATVR